MIIEEPVPNGAPVAAQGTCVLPETTMSRQHEVQLHRLRPTQITIGLIEVALKRKALEALGKHEQRDFLAAHLIPAVLGPEERIFITDHHHLARAALEAGIETGLLLIEAAMAQLEPKVFWHTMREQHWAHPIDEQGHAQPCSAIPKHLIGLRDDVYRSLAGVVRDAGGYEKTPTAFAEFVWAEFFRHRIVIGPTAGDFKHAVEQALALAKSAVARELPGHRG
jgi:hypothetical protein